MKIIKSNMVHMKQALCRIVRPAHGFLATVGLVLTLLPHSASCSPILLNPPGGWNGFAFEAHTQAGFRESGGGGMVEVKNQTFMLVGPSPDIVPGMVIESTPISVTMAPASGNAKDVASGELKFSFTVGEDDASSSDRFDFSLTSTTSASEALYDFGGGLVPVDAYFRAVLRLTTMGPMNPALDAFFGLPDMPTLNSPLTESMVVKVKKGPWSGPATLSTMLPGDTGVSVPLSMDSWSDTFTYEFTYEIITPHGTDPTYSYALNGSSGVAAVPEPASALMIGFGGLLIVGYRRVFGR